MKASSILAIVLFLSGVLRCQAAIQYSPLPDSPMGFRSWDVNLDGIVDFTFRDVTLSGDIGVPDWLHYSFAIYATESSYVLGRSVLGATILSADVEIGLSAPATGTWLQPAGGLGVGSWSFFDETWTGWSGPVESEQEGFLGLRFLASDGYHFGWLHVSREGDGPGGRIIATEFAWETRPETALSAGIVPEPSIVALATLGLGAMGLAGRLKLRR